MSSYGATEVGYVFIECEIGQFHQNSEFCRVDFQPLKPSHGGPALGRILVTTFNNPWYIIVRFDVGDLVHLSSESSCSCQKGSGLILDSVEGRVSTVTLTCRGRLVTVHELDKALGVLEGIDEYRLEQETQDIYHLHLVSQREDRSKLQKDCVKVLRALYGEESKILIDFDAALSPSVSGKYSVSQALFPINIEDYLDERYISKRNIQ
ncbi:hypothetical protein MUP77_00350 [Candidatus Bathyarchaeota archaeon]|nr:hypothetical protein [Candidatus Bathyarchaeota archaeon]